MTAFAATDLHWPAWTEYLAYAGDRLGESVLSAICSVLDLPPGGKSRAPNGSGIAWRVTTHKSRLKQARGCYGESDTSG
jgi:hypothetical protein